MFNADLEKICTDESLSHKCACIQDSINKFVGCYVQVGNVSFVRFICVVPSFTIIAYDEWLFYLLDGGCHASITLWECHGGWPIVATSWKWVPVQKIQGTKAEENPRAVPVLDDTSRHGEITQSYGRGHICRGGGQPDLPHSEAPVGPFTRISLVCWLFLVELCMVYIYIDLYWIGSMVLKGENWEGQMKMHMFGVIHTCL